MTFANMTHSDNSALQSRAQDYMAFHRHVLEKFVVSNNKMETVCLKSIKTYLVTAANRPFPGLNLIILFIKANLDLKLLFRDYISGFGKGVSYDKIYVYQIFVLARCE